MKVKKKITVGFETGHLKSVGYQSDRLTTRPSALIGYAELRKLNIELHVRPRVLNMFFYFILTDILISFNGVAFYFYAAHFPYCEFATAPFFRAAQPLNVSLHCILTGGLYLTRRHHVIRSSLTSTISREFAS